MKCQVKIHVPEQLGYYLSKDWEEFDVSTIDGEFTDGVVVSPGIYSKDQPSYLYWKELTFKNPEDKETLRKLDDIKSIII